MALLNATEMNALLEQFEQQTILAKIAAEELTDADARNKLKQDVELVFVTLRNAIPRDEQGRVKEDAWTALPEMKRDSLQREVRQAIVRFQMLSAPGPREANHVMAQGYPNQKVVLVMLTAIGALTLLLLGVIFFTWDHATYSSERGKLAIAQHRQSEINQREEAARRRADAEKLDASRAELEKQLAPIEQRYLVLKSQVDVVNRHKFDARQHLAQARKAVKDGAGTAANSLAAALDLVQKGEKEAARLLGGEPTSQDDVPAGGESDGQASNPKAGDLTRRIEAIDRKLHSLSLQVDSLLARVQNESSAVTRLRTQAEAATNKRDQALADARRLETEARQTKLSLEQLEATVDAAKVRPPTERAIVLMVMLIGASGGCLRLIASLVAYIGNRELKRSWVPYYCLMPLQSATLATIVYLFVRAGTFSATVAPAESTDKLNLFNIYVYAGFAGMFAKDVTVKLRDLLNVFFQSKTRERNPLGGERPPTT